MDQTRCDWVGCTEDGQSLLQFILCGWSHQAVSLRPALQLWSTNHGLATHTLVLTLINPHTHTYIHTSYSCHNNTAMALLKNIINVTTISASNINDSNKLYQILWRSSIFYCCTKLLDYTNVLAWKFSLKKCWVKKRMKEMRKWEKYKL